MRASHKKVGGRLITVNEYSAATTVGRLLTFRGNQRTSPLPFCSTHRPLGGQSRVVSLMPYRSPGLHPRSDYPRTGQPIGTMKANRSAKMREFAQALAAAGIGTLDDQARSSRLSRSTTWTIVMTPRNKSTGISATPLTVCWLHSRPCRSRYAKIIEYVEETRLAAMATAARNDVVLLRTSATKLAARRRLGDLAPLQPDMDVETIVVVSTELSRATQS